ncbi:hypothetical protein PVAP13_9KG189400 [Panicum virgatum]|uniref:Uncharacterized protein n=1 Tax=Panicum virgatum TaxID=38727 RepID=A0A8T0NK58_PANVG|nr:hypothetical protein PVAP13_9KG189400 [Panicum virgatum]
MPLHRPSAASEPMAFSGARLASPYRPSNDSLSAAAGFPSTASCSVRAPNGPKPAAYQSSLNAWQLPPPGMPIMPTPAKCTLELEMAPSNAPPHWRILRGLGRSYFQSRRPLRAEADAAACRRRIGGGRSCRLPRVCPQHRRCGGLLATGALVLATAPPPHEE